MKEPKKQAIQDGEELYRSMFGDDSLCDTPQYEDVEAEIDAYDESIILIKDMLNYSIERKDKEEIASWRRMLAQAKFEKRRLLSA